PCYSDMSSYTAWINLWGSSNTTVDSNGFIKRASPLSTSALMAHIPLISRVMILRVTATVI
ncbi:hypothetical protein, partial [Proteus myxofaciens]|uniref:hypothetical protein n=1 Tax=Proteus myxofaciens TaxID=184072 RepID=UPI001B30DFEF